MATALFITQQDLVRNSIISGNVDYDKIIQFVRVSQEIDVQNLLGTDLYNRISADIIAGTLTGNYLSLVTDFIQPTLIWFAQMNYIPFSAYTIAKGGVYKHQAENSQSVDKNEIDFLVEKARTNAEWYSRRFIDFMSFNQATYPEYTNNVNDDIYPSYEATFNGWVL